MKITAQDLKRLGVIDQIIPEPLGGAHRDALSTMTAVGEAISAQLAPLSALSAEAVRQDRRDKFLAIGRTAFA